MAQQGLAKTGLASCHEMSVCETWRHDEPAFSCLLHFGPGAKADRVGTAMADLTVCGTVPPYDEMLAGKRRRMKTSAFRFWKAGFSYRLVASNLLARIGAFRDLHGLTIAEVVRWIEDQAFVAQQAGHNLDLPAKVSSQGQPARPQGAVGRDGDDVRAGASHQEGLDGNDEVCLPVGRLKANLSVNARQQVRFGVGQLHFDQQRSRAGLDGAGSARHLRGQNLLGPFRDRYPGMISRLDA